MSKELDMDVLVNNIRAYMSERGINQKELGLSAGISANSISSIMLKKTNPSMTTISKIAKVLKVTPEKLIGLEEIKFQVDMLENVERFVKHSPLNTLVFDSGYGINWGKIEKIGEGEKLVGIPQTRYIYNINSPNDSFEITEEEYKELLEEVTEFIAFKMQILGRKRKEKLPAEVIEKLKRFFID